MYDSAIASGGFGAFMAAVMIGYAAAMYMPSKWGRGFKLRWFALWMLWCGMTPIQPWYIDIPMMLAYMWLVESVWRMMVKRSTKVQT